MYFRRGHQVVEKFPTGLMMRVQQARPDTVHQHWISNQVAAHCRLPEHMPDPRGLATQDGVIHDSLTFRAAKTSTGFSEYRCIRSGCTAETLPTERTHRHARRCRPKASLRRLSPPRRHTSQFPGRTLDGRRILPLDCGVRFSIFALPEALAEGDLDHNQLKEFTMNEALELELVDLGDAKDETKGQPEGPLPEDDHTKPRRDF